MLVNPLTTVHPAYGRTVDLSVVVETDNFQYSVDVTERQQPVSEAFMQAAAYAESAPIVSVVVTSERPHRIGNHHSFGSNRLTAALRAHKQPVQYITIQPARFISNVSYNAPESRLEWESAEVRAYDGTGQELTSVDNVMGWLKDGGFILLVDPPQPARI